MKENDFDLELFFNRSTDLLCIAGYDGYFKKINPAVSRLLEYSMEELYSRPINDFVHPEDQSVTDRYRKKLRGEVALRNFENRYVTKSGKIVWLAWTSEPVPEKELIFAIAKDITHKKRQEMGWLKHLENLSRGNKELKQLSLTTSHDLRSPLSSLLTVFDLLDISRISDQETLELVEILKLTGENLKETLNNYVDLLSEKLSEDVKAEHVDLEETLEEVLQSVASLIRTSGTTIYSDFTKLRQVRFNRSYMESVLLNLITNSIKYAQPEMPPEITIRSEISDRKHRLIYSDNGRGFDMDIVKEKVFQMRETFHDHQESKGIGLYLVHSHVTNMGGEIQLESEKGKGARFEITFK